MERSVVTCLILIGLEAAASATGILVPKEPGLPPLAIKYHRVDATIRDQVAETRVEQVFTNHSDRQLEATYVFPLPENAAISEFAMMVNGKRVSGELLEKEKAVQVYEDIVRKMRDPGLLEFMGSNLLRVRVFPIPPKADQKIEVRYSEVLPYDSGVVRYLYPLKTGERASATQEDFSMSVHLSSRQNIRSVYCPTHEVGASRPSEREAVVGFEEEGGLLNKDFTLYYTVSEDEVGINVIPFREQGEDGFLLLLITPGTEVKDEDLVARDIVFVLDTSGSMAESGKIDQAKNALKQCLRSLPERDRFNIVRFSTDVDAFSEEMVPVSATSVAEAAEYLEKMAARGGTQIHEALLRALSFDTDRDRPSTVVFLTDGKPTVGVTDKEQILRSTKEANRHGARLFVFGVGPQVNTHLLDLLSDQNGGLSEYVKPEEEIEEKVSLLYGKMSRPVLADVELTFSNIDVYDLYPQKVSDLFSGLQVTLFGRYRTGGDTAITLAGEVNGKPKSFTYESTFPEVNLDNPFIPRLWATRKAGYLLDEIRLHGEDPELREEVVRLSKEYGIMTPYTAYLVTEDTAPRTVISRAERSQRWGAERMAPANTAGRGGVPDGEGMALRSGRVGAERQVVAHTGERRVSYGDTDEVAAKGPAAGYYFSESGEAGLLGGRSRDDTAYRRLTSSETGREAVVVARDLRRLKDSQELRELASDVRHVEGRTFVKIGSTWVDQEYREVQERTVVEIKYASDAYFALLRAKKGLAKFFALGEEVIVKCGGVFLKVGEEGKETLSPEEIEDMFSGS